MRRTLGCIVRVMVIGASLAGCTTAPTNPSFDLTATDARRALREMRDAPRTLERPVVVLDGIGPPLASWLLTERLRRAVGDDRVVGVTFVFAGSFDECRRRVIEAVERRFPSADPDYTREVDVVAVSMGGVVARYAAAPPPVSRGKRLKIARLFTISSPHRGAEMAALPALLGRLQLDMREDSRFLRRLQRREAEGMNYELFPYARLGDRVVGERNAAPVGHTLLWLPNLPLEAAHLLCYTDPRIIADIARRLRREEPFADARPEPLPKG
jgi:pimeloyl-ACP methyl ester carboxylesterase